MPKWVTFSAHLLDANESRLIKTAKRCGVRVIKVSRRGKRGQHIDLCGKPLEKALRECEVRMVKGEGIKLTANEQELLGRLWDDEKRGARQETLWD